MVKRYANLEMAPLENSLVEEEPFAQEPSIREDKTNQSPFIILDGNICDSEKRDQPEVNLNSQQPVQIKEEAGGLD